MSDFLSDKDIEEFDYFTLGDCFASRGPSKLLLAEIFKLLSLHFHFELWLT